MQCKQEMRFSGAETTAEGLIFQRFFPVGKVYGPDVLVSAIADETVDLQLIFIGPDGIRRDRMGLRIRQLKH